MIIVRWCLAATLVLFVAGCNESAANFSQYPGFAEWYRRNPPSSDLPTAEQRALLQRYQPRIFLPADHEGPIDFYRDYIAEGVLIDDKGDEISAEVDQALLNARKTDPGMVFNHRPNGEATRPMMYGRIAEEEVDWPGCASPVPFTFLTYHLVFRVSGLPAGVPIWQAAGLELIADLDDWHQLDHYTAVTLALAPMAAGDQTPIAATFQQHNYQRTYLLEKTAPAETDTSGLLPWPEDDRLPVDVAIRSNELYPHKTGRSRRRAVSFLDEQSAAYMIADGKAPWLAADDITDPASESDPPLAFLPPDDAFYVFQGWLGERRRLPGRDGPPGADYNTLPAMKPLVNQMALSWWREGDSDWLARFEALRQFGRPEHIDPTPFIARMADRIELAC